MQSTGSKPDYRLLGAIVPASGGNLFFKVVGPAASVEANKGALDGLLSSLRPS
jgi:hypothetical protein